jgi:hypothetical protein
MSGACPYRCHLFFFLISKRNSLKAQEAQPKCTRSIQEKTLSKSITRKKKRTKIYIVRDTE